MPGFEETMNVKVSFVIPVELSVLDSPDILREYKARVEEKLSERFSNPYLDPKGFSLFVEILDDACGDVEDELRRREMDIEETKAEIARLQQKLKGLTADEKK